MADVVHQDGCLYGFGLRFEDEDTFLLKVLDGFTHQVEGAKGVLETRMTGTGINHRSQTQLVDTVQTLEQRMFHNAVKQTPGYPDKPEDGVVDDFNVIHGHKGTTNRAKCKINLDKSSKITN